jgi:hypothetical protein
MSSLSYLGSKPALILTGFGRVFGIDLHGLGIHDRFESTR